MSDLHPVFVRAKEILLNQGWFCGGPRGEHGEPCIVIACCDAYEEIYGYTTLFKSGAHLKIHDTLSEITGRRDVPGWNDDPTRTIEEVIAVLDKAILQTAPVEEFSGVR